MNHTFRRLTLVVGVTVFSCGDGFVDEGGGQAVSTELTGASLTVVNGVARDFYITDLEYNPLGPFVSGSTRQVFPLAAEARVLVHGDLDVPGHGRLWYSASNDGVGFSPSALPLDLTYEIARDRSTVAERLYSELTQRGINVASYRARLNLAKAELSQAATSAAGSTTRQQAAMRSLVQSAQVAEQLLVTDAQVRMTAKGGLSSNQRISTFALYAAREGSRWSNSAHGIFNSAVPNWHWQSVMQQNGSLNWNWYDSSVTAPVTLPSDAMVQGLTNQGLGLRGHCLAWLLGKPSWPNWLAWSSFPAVRDQIYRFSSEVVGKYPQIRTWNIANEIVNPPYVMFPLSNMVELVGGVASRARARNPYAALGINEVELWGLGAAKHRSDPIPVPGFAKFLRELQKASVPFDYIGMQLYYFMDRDMVEVDRMLARYSTLGKRIRVAETMAPAWHDGRANYWHRPWDSQLQAEWLESMFLVALSKNYVDEWNWWDLADYPGAYVPHGAPAGLLDRNYWARPSYFRLMDMVSWYRDRKYPVTGYDLAADWSDSRNPNGAWSYRGDYGTELLPHQNLTVGGAGHGWATSQTTIPSLFKRRGAYADIPSGTVGGHGPFRIDWVAPLKGRIAISADSGIWVASETTRRMTWALTVNDRLVRAGDVTRAQGNSQRPVTFGAGNSIGVDVESGSVVRLRVWQQDPSSWNTFVGLKWKMKYQ